VPRGILITLQPGPNAQVLARWSQAANTRKPSTAKPPDTAASAGLAAPVAAAAGIPVTAPPAGAEATGRPPGAPSSPPGSDLAVVRTGNVIFTGINLFAPPNDTAAVRQLFLSLFEQLAPGLAFDQARE